MLRKYVDDNNKPIYLTDRQLKIIADEAKKDNNKDVLKRVYLANPEIDNLDVNKEKASMGKELLKICGILIGEAGTIIAASQLGLAIPMPVVMLVAAGLTRFPILNMYSIAKKNDAELEDINNKTL